MFSDRFYIGPQPFVVISDMEMLKQIMVKDFDNFSDHTVSYSAHI